MKLICHLMLIAVLGAVIPCHRTAAKRIDNRRVKLHETTNWHIQASFKYDTLCFLGLLTGDPFYVNYYKNEYAKFEPQLTPPTRAALANLKRKIKDENGNIISGFLTLYFSATNDQTLDDMLRTVQDSERMKRNLKKSPYYNEAGWRLYESVRPDLRTVFVFLKSIKFEDYWQREILPLVAHKIAEVEKDLPKYNVIAGDERLLGFRLPSNKLTVFMLYYSVPHGIRITGMRFITDADYPFKILIRNAVHEPMHPPFDLAYDPGLKKALEVLQADTFLMDKINNHNSSFGYNSFAGFVEEDCVQALEQLINEKLKVEVEARRRWKENDDGMHVLAVALYSLMKHENYDGGKENFREFLLRMIGSGKLAAGTIKPLYDAFYA
jgi:hypothetical protein